MYTRLSEDVSNRAGDDHDTAEFCRMLTRHVVPQRWRKTPSEKLGRGLTYRIRHPSRTRISTQVKCEKAADFQLEIPGSSPVSHSALHALCQIPRTGACRHTVFAIDSTFSSHL